jgi:hypothetical protein
MNGQRGGRWRAVVLWIAVALVLVVGIGAATTLQPIATVVALRILNTFPSSGGAPVAIPVDLR